MNYGEVLSKAWQIIWKHKVLWIFGILAGCGSVGGNTGSGGGNVNYRFDSGDLPREFERFGAQVQRFFENIPAWVWLLLVIAFIILFIIAILLTTVGKIGLIRGAVLADEGTARLSFGPLFSESLPYFWRVFLMNLLVGLGLAVIFLILLIPLIIFSVVTVGIGLICLFPLICLLIPLSWFIGVVIEQSNVAIVAENRGIIDGLRRGWEVVTRNLGQYIVMLIILGVGGFIVALIVGIPVILLALPLVGGLAIGSEGALQGGALLSAALFCIYLPFLFLFNGIIQAYITSAWTLTFRRVTGRGPSAAVSVYPSPAAPPEPSI